MSNATSVIPSNQELVARRLTVAREKRAARERSIQQANARNYHLKRLIEQQQQQPQQGDGGDDPSNNFVVPNMYAVKVYVEEPLRHELKLSGREKRGRVFLETDSPAVSSLKDLRFELHAFFRALRKGSFRLAAGYPHIAADGSVQAPPELETYDNNNNNNETAHLLWPIENDEDVVQTFRSARDFFARHDDVLKRPSIVIVVQKDPDALPPPPPPAYLKNLANPADTTSMTMLSFYSFPPDGGIRNPDDFALRLRQAWKPFGALGRVYVAQEGVNAQMSVPTNVLDNFVACCRSIPELGAYMENGINIDPIPLSMEEFATAGVPADGVPTPPFRNLHIRVRNQIVADGLDQPLDWQSAGYDMPPLEWHAKIKRAQELQQQQQKSGETEADNNNNIPAADKEVPIILDCRNTYETDVGIFEQAEPLGTENFRDSWDVLKDRLADTPKDAPIMTYCTGGIRCVKVGAYLTQELGFTNVSRLAGGIIAYDRTLNEKAAEEDSLFKGTNFVFDGRLGRQITEDAMAKCVTCGAETSLVSNCRNSNCHKRMIQCENCRTDFHGTCSDACRNRVLNEDQQQQRAKASTAQHAATTTTPTDGEEISTATGSTTTTFPNLGSYCNGYSTPPPSLYREIEFNTRALIPSGSHMVSGSAQGRLLKQLAAMTREGRVLELGTFTGYATACLLEGAAEAAQTLGQQEPGSRSKGAYVMTMERDAKAFDVAVSHLSAVSKLGFGEEASEAVCALRAQDEVPRVEETVVSLELQEPAGVACELVHVSDALATVEEMASGGGFLRPAAFDMVFVDADKTRLLEYVDACLTNDSLLKKGGLIVVDNVLWKGLVLEANNGEFTSLSDEEDAEELEVRKNRRARKLATKMHYFNSEIVQDNRAEILLLPVRDGLSMIRKK